MSHTGGMEYLALPPGLLTTSMAAQACGVQPSTIRDWVRRGILSRCGGTPKRPYYRVADVMEARAAAKPCRPGQRGAAAA
ncbi:MerR family transcriptional regulator [Streptomyces sp. ME03-5709C]|nr:MerR family transcriptional regulator [Streptomyces sp. ME03-5709C]